MLQTQTFSCGSFAYQSDSNAYVLDLTVTQDAVDPVANTSDISYKLQLRSGANNRFNGYLEASVTVNGEQLAVADMVTITAAYNTTYILLSGSATLPHNNDGTLSLNASGSIRMLGETQTNPYAPPDMTVSGTMALTAIPRASTLAATSVFIEDTATIAVSRKAADYTHSIHYRFGELSGYLADAVGTHSDTEIQLTDTTILFPVPVLFYAQIPDKPADICTLTCTTYSGNTQIGDAQTTAFTVTADPARCAPVVSGRAEDVNEATLALTGDSSCIVQGLSDVLCTPEAAARQGASITALSVCGEALSGGTYTLVQASTAQILIRATDSRGYTTEYTVPGLSLIPYVPLSFHASAARTDPTGGDAVLTLQGKWYEGSFGAADNALSARCRVDDGDWQSFTPQSAQGEVTGEVALSGLDYRTGHTVQVQLADALQSVSKSVAVSRGIPVFDWGAEDFVFHVPVRFTATDGTVFTIDLVDGQLTAS